MFNSNALHTKAPQFTCSRCGQPPLWVSSEKNYGICTCAHCGTMYYGEEEVIFQQYEFDDETGSFLMLPVNKPDGNCWIGGFEILKPSGIPKHRHWKPYTFSSDSKRSLIKTFDNMNDFVIAYKTRLAQLPNKNCKLHFVTAPDGVHCFVVKHPE